MAAAATTTTTTTTTSVSALKCFNCIKKGLSSSEKRTGMKIAKDCIAEHPIQLGHGDPEAGAKEQTPTGNMEIVVPPPSPAADLATGSPTNLSEPVPERRYPVRERKPQARLDLN